MTHLKMNRFYYNPLPEYLELGKSDIHGHGIFATKQLRKNFDLGSSTLSWKNLYVTNLVDVDRIEVQSLKVLFSRLIDDISNEKFFEEVDKTDFNKLRNNVIDDWLCRDRWICTKWSYGL